MIISLVSKTANFTGKVQQNSELSASEISDINSASAIFLIHRTAMTIDNFLFTTKYDVVVTTTKFITSLQVSPLAINITNSEFVVAGQIFLAETPIKLYLSHIVVDYYKTRFGFNINIACGEVGPIEETSVTADNMYFYYSQAKVNNLGQRHALVHRGWGDFYVRNSTFEIYSDAGDSSSPVTRFNGQTCDLDTTKR